MKIFVGNLSFAATETDVKNLFEGFGEVAGVRILMEKNGVKSRGFGFADMPDDQQAQEAITALNGKEFMGRPLNIEQARIRPEVPPEVHEKEEIKPENESEGRHNHQEDAPNKEAWFDPVFNKKKGRYKTGRRSRSYMKRRAEAGIVEEAAPRRKPQDNPMRWRKRSEQPKPWQRKDNGSKPWGERTGESKPWQRRDSESKPWEKRTGESKPWKKTEGEFRPQRQNAQESRPWKRSEGKPWQRKDNGSKPWGERTGESKPWKKTEGGFRPERQNAGESRPWRKSSPKPWQRRDSESKPWLKSREERRPWKKNKIDSKPLRKKSKPPRRHESRIQSRRKPGGYTRGN